MKRILLLLAVVAMLVLVLAPAAQAQTIHGSTPVTGNVQNPCNPEEEIAVEGTLYYTVRIQEDSSGGLHVLFHNTLVAQGVSESGAKYVIQSVGPATYHVYSGDQGTVSVLTVTSVKYISQGETGTEDDFTGRFIYLFTVNANGEVTAELQNVVNECR